MPKVVRHRPKSLKRKSSDFSHFYKLCRDPFCLFKYLYWPFCERKTERKLLSLSKLFHCTHAWANSLFLEVDTVFCELFTNLRNGDRQPAKTSRGGKQNKACPFPATVTFFFLAFSCFIIFCFSVWIQEDGLKLGLSMEATRSPDILGFHIICERGERGSRDYAINDPLIPRGLVSSWTCCSFFVTLIPPLLSLASWITIPCLCLRMVTPRLELKDTRCHQLWLRSKFTLV